MVFLDSRAENTIHFIETICVILVPNASSKVLCQNHAWVGSLSILLSAGAKFGSHKTHSLSKLRDPNSALTKFVHMNQNT